MEVRPWEMTAAEGAAIVELFRDELVRGWIPAPADLEAALHLVRSAAVEAAAAYRVAG